MQNTFKYYEVCKYTVYETQTHSSVNPTIQKSLSHTARDCVGWPIIIITTTIIIITTIIIRIQAAAFT